MDAALSVSPDLLKPAAAPASAADLAKRGQIQSTAQDFEAAFLSVMLGQMFSGDDEDGPLGSGQGGAMFKSFLTESFAKQMAKSGGVGVGAAVQRELLKLQGLG